MPRRRPIRTYNDSDTDDEFQTPSPPPNATNYTFDYTNNSSRRIVNPNEPSTSAAARSRYFARKSTSAGPHGRHDVIREHLSQTQDNVPSRRPVASPESRSTRNLSRTQPANISPDRRPTKSSTRTEHAASNVHKARQERRKQRKPMRLRNRLENEIRRLQQYQGFLMPRAPFGRLLREIMHETSDNVRMITKTALEGVQEACETYLVQVLTDAYALTLHRGRITLMPKDIQLLRVIRLIE